MKATIFAATSRKLVESISLAPGRKLRWLVMALGVFVGLVSSVFAADTTPKLALHTFTDQQGHLVEAAIASVVEPNVYLQRVEGEPFKVKIEVFSESDQAYIRKWAREHSGQALSDPFQISVAPSTTSDPDSSPAQGFKVMLKNRSGKNLGALRVEYILFRFSTKGVSARNSPTRQTGEILVKDLRAANDVVVETDRMNGDGAKMALWVRVYDNSNKLLQEWTSSPIIAHEKWDSASGEPNLVASSPTPGRASNK